MPSSSQQSLAAASCMLGLQVCLLSMALRTELSSEVNTSLVFDFQYFHPAEFHCSGTKQWSGQGWDVLSLLIQVVDHHGIAEHHGGAGTPAGPHPYCRVIQEFSLGEDINNNSKYVIIEPYFTKSW